jgi:hypothetical protein
VAIFGDVANKYPFELLAIGEHAKLTIVRLGLDESPPVIPPLILEAKKQTSACYTFQKGSPRRTAISDDGGE